MRSEASPLRSPQILALIGASFVIALGYGIVSPALPQFAREFGVGIGAASALVSAFAVMRLLFAPVSGGLVQRLGERRVYLAGLLIVAASTGACAFSADYVQLLVFRALGGIGSTMFTVSALGLLIRLSPPEARGRVAALYSGSFLLGGVAGPLVGAALVGFGLRMPFVVYAVALVVAAAIVFLVVRDERRAPAGEPSEDPPAETRLRLSEALRSPLYRASVASSFATGWAIFGVRSALVPLLVTEALGRSTAEAAIALAVFALGNAAVLTFSGRLSDRFGRRPFMLLGLALGAVATALTGFAGGSATLLALMLVGGVFSGLMGPAQQAALADVVGQRARGGPVIAVYQMSSDLGAVAGPLVAGALAGGVGFGPAFASAGIVLFVAAVMWLFAPNTGPGRAPGRAG